MSVLEDCAHATGLLCRRVKGVEGKDNLCRCFLAGRLPFHYGRLDRLTEESLELVGQGLENDWAVFQLRVIEYHHLSEGGLLGHLAGEVAERCQLATQGNHPFIC